MATARVCAPSIEEKAGELWMQIEAIAKAASGLA